MTLSEPSLPRPATLAWLALAAIVAVGAALRFYDLAAASLWIDEAATWFQSHESLADLIARTARDNYPPLHNLVVFATINLIGDSEWAMRLPSALFGVVNIAAVYWLGCLTVGRTAGLVGAALLALSPYHIWYSQEARAYTLLALAATLFAIAAISFLQRPSLLKSLWIALSGIMLWYAHPYGPLNWLGIGLAVSVLLVFRRPKIGLNWALVWIVANLAIVAGYAPWQAHFLGRAGAVVREGFWVPPVTPTYVWEQLTLVGGGWITWYLLLPGIALAVIGRQPSRRLVLFSWALLPIAIGIGISLVTTPIFYHRYLIGGLPALVLLAAFGYTRYLRAPISLIVGGAVVAGAFLGFVNVGTTMFKKDDWRGVTPRIALLGDDGCLAINPHFLDMILNYYATYPCVIKISHLRNITLPPDRMVAVFTDYKWTEDSTRFVAALEANGWRQTDAIEDGAITVLGFRK